MGIFILNSCSYFQQFCLETLRLSRDRRNQTAINQENRKEETRFSALPEQVFRETQKRPSKSVEISREKILQAHSNQEISPSSKEQGNDTPPVQSSPSEYLDKVQEKRKDSGSDPKESVSSRKSSQSSEASYAFEDQIDSPKPIDLASLRNIKTMDDLLKLGPKRPIATISLNEAQAKFGSKVSVSEISNTLFTEAVEPMKNRILTRESMSHLMTSPDEIHKNDVGHFFEEVHFNSPTSCSYCRVNILATF